MRDTNYRGLEEQREDHKKYLAALADLKEQASMLRMQGSSYDRNAIPGGPSPSLLTPNPELITPNCI